MNVETYNSVEEFNSDFMRRRIGRFLADKEHCYNCDYTFTDNDSINLVSNNINEVLTDYYVYCNECFDEELVYCNCCDNLIYTDQSHSMDDYGDIRICNDCLESDYFYCDNCNHLFNNDCYAGGGVCEYCQEQIEDDNEDYEDDNRLLHSYDYKPYITTYYCKDETKLHKNTFDRPVLYGVELEVDAKERTSQDYTANVNSEIWERNNSRKNIALNRLGNIDTHGSQFYMKHDSSLYCGIEIVTMPMTLEYHKREMPWDKVLDICRERNFISHDTSTCGLHIHVGKTNLSYIESVKLGVMVYTNQYVFERLARRKNNGTCTFYKKRTLRETCSARGRYEAINWTNQNTIEFRMFRGTLKYTTLIASIELLDCLIHFIKSKTLMEVYDKQYFNTAMGFSDGAQVTEASINSYINGRAWKSFCDYVHSHKNKYVNLNSYIKERGVKVCV